MFIFRYVVQNMCQQYLATNIEFNLKEHQPSILKNTFNELMSNVPLNSIMQSSEGRWLSFHYILYLKTFFH